MDGLTAKVFRTYNASWTFAQQLKNTPKDASVADKLLAYNRANRLVAVLCNHQRSVSKGHTAAMEKLLDKVRSPLAPVPVVVAHQAPCSLSPLSPAPSPSPMLARSYCGSPSQIRALKYQRMKLRKQLFAVADKPKKYKEPYGDDESDLDDDWIKEHEAALVVAEREKIRKKFDKDNTKREADGEKKLPQKELDERLKAADDLEKQIRRDRKQGYTETKLGEDRLVTALGKMDERIQIAKTNATDRDEGKGASLPCSRLSPSGRRCSPPPSLSLPPSPCSSSFLSLCTFSSCITLLLDRPLPPPRRLPSTTSFPVRLSQRSRSARPRSTTSTYARPSLTSTWWVVPMLTFSPLQPRISVAWAKANDVPLNKVMTKTLLEKFQWATHVEADFEW